MNSSKFDFNIIQINSGVSTNIYAQKLLGKENVQEGLVLLTDFQENGKGQQHEKWEAEAGKNLLFSIILKPNLNVGHQFQLSKVISVGLKNYLDSLSVGVVEIKWPNDLLVNGHKIAGILIENSVVGKQIKASIVGIGLNVNQLKFNNFSRPATSLALLGKEQFDLENCLKQLLKQIKFFYNQLSESQEKINELYLEALYGWGKPMNFEDESGQFIGVIIGILPNGRLQLNRDGKLKNYELKGLRFL